MLGAVERLGDSLIDRNGNCLRRRFNLVPAVDGYRFIVHLALLCCASEPIDRTNASLRLYRPAGPRSAIASSSDSEQLHYCLGGDFV